MSRKPNHSLNSSRHYCVWPTRTTAVGILVLRSSAGTLPYRNPLGHAVYESADFEAVAKAWAPSTYVCNPDTIPVKAERSEHIVLNQALEHLPEPAKALREVNRVLEPGGKIICTWPQSYEEHKQPSDFYRDTNPACAACSPRPC